MDLHLAALQAEVEEKRGVVLSLSLERDELWGSSSSEERAFHTMRIQEARDELMELKGQLNATKVAYVVRPFGVRHYTQAHVDELACRLKVPLTREDVSMRQAGGRTEVVYLETHKALEKARDVFGLAEFSIEVRGEPTVLFQSANKLCMKALVRITLANGCFHEDVGVASSNLSDPVEAAKLATKACVSDGIKRVLQHFGPALGSCLRDKDYVARDLMPETKRARQLQPPRVSPMAAASSRHYAMTDEESVYACELTEKLMNENKA